MSAGLLGRKLGMTRHFLPDGKNVPVTVILTGPCAVTQVKTTESDGYAAVQVAFEAIKPRRSTMPVMGHDAKAGVEPKRFHREFRLKDDKAAGEFTLGQELTVETLADVKYVDVIGISKGKGFQGVMKRHNFSGMEASHGVERKHRSRGSIAGRATNRGWGPKPKKGMKMPGQMGAGRVTVRNLDVVSFDPKENVLLVKGPVPGPNHGFVVIRPSIRLGRSKQGKNKAGK